MGRHTSKSIEEKVMKEQSKSRVRRLLEKISHQAQGVAKEDKTGKRKYPMEFTNWFIY